MIVVKNELIIDESGLFFYESQLFTGVMIELKDGFINCCKECERGVLTRDFTLPFPIYKTGCIYIDDSLLDGDDEPYLYQGSLYEGISFYFENGICLEIRQFENGEESSKAQYTKYGQLYNLEHILSDESLIQEYRWDENDNKLTDISIYAPGKFQFSTHLDNGEYLSLLVLRGDYFKNVKSVNDHILVNQFKDAADFEHVISGEYLRISGLDVDDDLLNTLIMNDGLKSVCQLQIYDTKISSTGLNKLNKLKNLKELYVESDVLVREELIGFKSAHPECYIRFNDEEIVI